MIYNSNSFFLLNIIHEKLTSFSANPQEIKRGKNKFIIIHFKLSGKQRRFIILTLLFILSPKLRDEEIFRIGLRAYFMFFKDLVFHYNKRHPVFSAKHPSGLGDVGFFSRVYIPYLSCNDKLL